MRRTNRGSPAGVRRDFDTLEKRRMEAIRLLEKRELNQSDVARRLRVGRQTVSRWAEEFKAGGKDALKKAGCTGRKPDLTETDRKRLEELLLNGPEEFGYETLRQIPPHRQRGGGQRLQRHRHGFAPCRPCAMRARTTVVMLGALSGQCAWRTRATSRSGWPW